MQAASTWGIPTDNKPEDDLAKGRSMLTKGEESNLRHAFEMFDHDRSGDLSQGEIIKLLLRMNMAGNKHDAIQTMRRMDVDCDGSVDEGLSCDSGGCQSAPSGGQWSWLWLAGLTMTLLLRRRSRARSL